MKEIDARGLACPQPVILAKKAMKAGERDIMIHVDNSTAAENLKRLADSQGYVWAVMEEERGYVLTLLAGAEKEEAEAPQQTEKTRKTDVDTLLGNEDIGLTSSSWAVFVGRDIIGAGDRELGGNLMRMYFYTLAQSETPPAAILFMNDGVKVPTLDGQIREHLRTLEERGVRILVCGTCLSFYGLMEKLKVGTVSNMYDIVEEMGRWSKVISL